MKFARHVGIVKSEKLKYLQWCYSITNYATGANMINTVIQIFVDHEHHLLARREETTTIPDVDNIILVYSCVVFNLTSSRYIPYLWNLNCIVKKCILFLLGPTDLSHWPLVINPIVLFWIKKSPVKKRKMGSRWKEIFAIWFSQFQLYCSCHE